MSRRASLCLALLFLTSALSIEVRARDPEELEAERAFPEDYEVEHYYEDPSSSISSTANTDDSFYIDDGSGDPSPSAIEEAMLELFEDAGEYLRGDPKTRNLVVATDSLLIVASDLEDLLKERDAERDSARQQQEQGGELQQAPDTQAARRTAQRENEIGQWTRNFSLRQNSAKNLRLSRLLTHSPFP